jgi:rhodanese-related sulfurtransferase
MRLAGIISRRRRMVENIHPRQVWEALRGNPDARLVDCRTEVEWNFVGVPDLSEVGKETILIPWQVHPTMQVNGAFMEHLARAGVEPRHHVYFLCRTGVRSSAAAHAARAAGFQHVYNIADGFEGPPDPNQHRGTVAGWKADGLPWRQK